MPPCSAASPPGGRVMNEGLFVLPGADAMGRDAGGWQAPLCVVPAVSVLREHLGLTGDFAGGPFLLMPWQRQVLRDIFGTLDDEGLRKYKDVYMEVPTGNSKTTFCAGLVLFFLVCDCGTGTEIYSAATAKDQAAITFRMAQQMVLQSRKLRSALSVIPSTKRIVRKDDPTSSLLRRHLGRRRHARWNESVLRGAGRIAPVADP